MTTHPTKFQCTQPGCEAEYNDKAHLGIHLRAAHGIKGKSKNSIKRRQKLKDAEKATATQPNPKRRYTKRSTTLATIPQEVNGNASNGQVQAQTVSRRFHAEAALAVAFGQFKELCKGVAFEYDLPPRSFTARFVEFLHAEALR
jgi:hypothetical protein